MIFLIYVLLGLAGGLIGGMFGVGGGVIVVPMLVLGLGFSQQMAQGTMLTTFILPSFIFAVWKYHQAGNIHLPAALTIALGMMIGSAIGAFYAHQMATPVLKKMFGVLMVVVGLRLIFWK